MLATIHDHESRIAQLEAELAKVNAWAEKVSMVREELIQRMNKASSLFEDYVSYTDAKLADATARAERAEKALVELHDALELESGLSIPMFGVGQAVDKYDRPDAEPCIVTNGEVTVWQNEAPHAYEWVKAREQEVPHA